MDINVDAPDDEQREAAARLDELDKAQEEEYERWNPLLEKAAKALAKRCKRAYDARDDKLVLRAYARVKEWDKLLPKLHDGRADPWDTCTDLLAMRIVVLKTSDIRRAHSAVGGLVKEDSAVEQRWFGPGASAKGYQARHVQLEIPDDWDVPTNTKSVGAELQLMTVMQEAWSALSHDDFYKSLQGVPEKLSSRVFRLAGVMNLVDEELDAIPKALKAQLEVAHTAFAEMHERGQEREIKLDEANLYAAAGTGLKDKFIELRQLGRDAGFVISGDKKLVRPGFDSEVFLQLARELDMKTIAQLRDACDSAHLKKAKLAELADGFDAVEDSRGTLFDRPLTVLSAALMFDHAPRVKSPLTEDITRVLYRLLD